MVAAWAPRPPGPPASAPPGTSLCTGLVCSAHASSVTHGGSSPPAGSPPSPASPPAGSRAAMLSGGQLSLASRRRSRARYLLLAGGAAAACWGAYRLSRSAWLFEQYAQFPHLHAHLGPPVHALASRLTPSRWLPTMHLVEAADEALCAHRLKRHLRYARCIRGLCRQKGLDPLMEPFLHSFLLETLRV